MGKRGKQYPGIGNRIFYLFSQELFEQELVRLRSIVFLICLNDLYHCFAFILSITAAQKSEEIPGIIVIFHWNREPSKLV